MKKISYRLKVFLWFTVLASSVAAVFGFVNYTVTEDALSRGMEKSLIAAAKLCAMQVDTKSIPYLKLKGAVNAELTEKLKVISDSAGLKDIIIIDMKLTPVYSFSGGMEFVLAGLDSYEIRKALSGKEIATPLFRTQEGYFKSAYVPVIKAGKVEAITGVTASADYVKYIEKYRRASITAFILIIFVSAGISVILTFGLTKNLRRLVAAASAISKRDFGAEIKINAEPEIAGLADAMESMRKEIYTYLNEREKMATAGEFAAGVAHEIRNALGSLQGRAELLLERISDEKMKRDATDIISGVRRMSGFLNNFLFYTKDFTPEPARMNLKEFVKETVLELAPEISSCVRFVGDEKAEAVFDLNLMKIALGNIVINAYQAADKDKKIIEIYYEKDMICVSDNGPGIRKEQKDNIFKPFFTGRKNGTGLGLAIVYKIVKDIHKGEIITGESSYKGAKFTIKFSGENK